jgi:hypothetical protein
MWAVGVLAGGWGSGCIGAMLLFYTSRKTVQQFIGRTAVLDFGQWPVQTAR